MRHEFGTQSRRCTSAWTRSPRSARDGKPRRLQVRIQPGIPAETASPCAARRRRAGRLPPRAGELPRRRRPRRPPRAAPRPAALRRRAGGVTVGPVVAGWVVAGRALRPIARITATARSISDRTLHERIGLGGPRDELRELADVFDTMLGRLEGAFESQRRFVANASHELRTPLAIVRTELDVTLADPDAASATCARWRPWSARRTSAWSGSSPACWRWPRARAASADPRPADLAAACGRRSGPRLPRAGRAGRVRRAGSGEAALQPAVHCAWTRGWSPAPVQRRRRPARAPGRQPRRERRSLQRRARLGAVETGVEAGRAILASPTRASPSTRPTPRSSASRSGAWRPHARARPAATASAWPSCARGALARRRRRACGRATRAAWRSRWPCPPPGRPGARRPGAVRDRLTPERRRSSRPVQESPAYTRHY